MTPLRTLRKGMAGEDVRAVKERLLALGMYESHITALKKDSFGSDTYRAVCAFQRANGIDVTGCVDEATYAALMGDDAAAPQQQDGNAAEAAALPLSTNADVPANIGAEAAASIAEALGSVSLVRRRIALEALRYAFDRSVPRAYPLSLYIRGGNLYNKDLTPNVITLQRIASGAARQPEFYDGGRREMMEAAVRADPSITGADCSGGVVGLFRHAGLVSAGFDASANGMARKYRAITRAELLPGDLAHKDGHIGMYVGGAYVVEWMGGAYGCQLTELPDRRGYSFVSGKTGQMGAWTGFLRPSYYEDEVKRLWINGQS